MANMAGYTVLGQTGPLIVGLSQSEKEIVLHNLGSSQILIEKIYLKPLKYSDKLNVQQSWGATEKFNVFESPLSINAGEEIAIPPIQINRLEPLEEANLHNDTIYYSIKSINFGEPFEVTVDFRSVDEKNQKILESVSAKLKFIEFSPSLRFGEISV
jgi:hypothetical protein